jgi:glycosyltransferase involved in cell wall biosynthesis
MQTAPLTIIHVVLSLSPGGTERLVIDLARRTRGQCASSICCLDDEGEWATELTHEGIQVVALRRAPGFRPSLGWRLASLIRERGADVLHCHQYSPFVYGAMAAIMTASGCVFTEHGRLSDSPPSSKRKFVNPLLGRLGFAMFAVSTHLREHMIAEGFPASNLGVIQNGIDCGPPPTSEARHAARRRLQLPPDACTIGTAARLDPVKDLGTLVRAFDELRRSHASLRLVVIGDGPERQRLVAECALLGVEPLVTFTGHRADVRDLLPALDIYVNCSTSEGISLTILEAMATGLPVVATSIGGTPEVVVHDRTGLLVPAKDPRRLAGALSDLISDSERRRAFGTEGRRRVLERFTVDRMVTAYVTQYQRAAGNRRRALTPSR